MPAIPGTNWIFFLRYSRYRSTDLDQERSLEDLDGFSPHTVTYVSLYTVMVISPIRTIVISAEVCLPL